MGSRLKQAWRRRKRPASEHASLCLLPWSNISIDVDGSTRPCCKFEHLDHVDGHPLGNVAGTSIAEAWNSAGMVELRRQFRSGERPAGCSSCWAEEAAGVESFRQTYLEHRRIPATADLEDLHPPQPLGLDLKLSNTCNLACRICGPVASSRWLTEELRAAATPGPDAPSGPFIAYLDDNRRYLADSKLLHRLEDRSILQAWAPNVRHLELTGGEPMLSKESADLLVLLAEHGDPGQVTLQITTNASTMNARIVDRLPEFSFVNLSLSIDDVGTRFDYQRDQASWPEVEQNIERYASMVGPNLQVYLNPTVSILNAWDLGELLTWWHERYGVDYRVGLNLNMLHSPAEMCVQQLPEAAKERLVRRWRLLGDRSAPLVAEQLEQVTSFATARAADPDSWPRFLDRTAALDRRREQDFARTYPSFVAELGTIGCWPNADVPVALQGRAAPSDPEAPVGR